MNTKNQWSSYADSFDAFDDYNHFLPDLFDLLGTIDDRKILDLGCSNGLMCRLLSDLGARVSGIDVSEHAIDIARELSAEPGQKITYAVADAIDLSLFSDAAFDRVLAVNTLCSFGDDPQVMRRIVEETHRVLSPEGCLVAVIPHPAFEHRQKGATRYRKFPDCYTYFHGGTEVEFELTVGDRRAKFSNFHWTLEAYSRFFSGLFYIQDIREPEPDDKFDAVHPKLFVDGAKYPIYLVLKCVRC